MRSTIRNLTLVVVAVGASLVLWTAGRSCLELSPMPLSTDEPTVASPGPVEQVDGFTLEQMQFLDLLTRLRADVRADLSTNLERATERIDTRIAKSEAEMTRWFITVMMSLAGLIIAATGVLVAVLRGWSLPHGNH